MTIRPGPIEALSVIAIGMVTATTSQSAQPDCTEASFPPRHRNGTTATYFTHMFDMRCRENGIEHRLTKIKHPWTNGQVERMNRTIKGATVKRYHYDDHAQLRSHLADFLDAYNFARRLKTLGGLTPYEFICKTWTSEPERFTLDVGGNPSADW